jgi:hypothetical protein
MNTPLNELMSFGHVVYSDGNGNVTDEYDDTVFGPETVYVYLDADGQAIKQPGASDFDIDMAGYGDWQLLRGFTGQDSYNGAIMHASEYIGGGLERFIRENAGYYVAVIVDGLVDDPTGDAETVPDGWAVAFKDLT